MKHMNSLLSLSSLYKNKSYKTRVRRLVTHLLSTWDFSIFLSGWQQMEIDNKNIETKGKSWINNLCVRIRMYVVMVHMIHFSHDL